MDDWRDKLDRRQSNKVDNTCNGRRWTNEIGHSVYHTERPAVCVQHYALEAARRAGLSASADTCCTAN